MKHIPSIYQNWDQILWSEYTIINNGIGGFERYFEICDEITYWIISNVEQPLQNSAWMRIGDAFYIKLKHQQDMIALKLRI